MGGARKEIMGRKESLQRAHIWVPKGDIKELKKMGDIWVYLPLSSGFEFRQRRELGKK